MDDPVDVPKLIENSKQLEHEIKNLRERKQALEEYLLENEVKIETLTAQIESDHELNKQLKGLKEINVSKENEIQRLSDLLEKIERENGVIMTEKKRLEGMLRDLETVSSRSSDDTFDEHQECCERILELEDQLSQVTQNAEKIKECNTELKNELEILTQQYKEAQHKIHNLEQLNQELQSQQMVASNMSLCDEMLQSQLQAQHSPPPSRPRSSPPRPRSSPEKVREPSPTPKIEEEPSVDMTSLNRLQAERRDKANEMVPAPVSTEAPMPAKRSRVLICCLMLLLLLVVIGVSLYVNPPIMILDATNMNDLYDRYQYI